MFRFLTENKQIQVWIKRWYLKPKLKKMSGIFPENVRKFEIRFRLDTLIYAWKIYFSLIILESVLIFILEKWRIYFILEYTWIIFKTRVATLYFYCLKLYFLNDNLLLWNWMFSWKDLTNHWCLFCLRYWKFFFPSSNFHP